jgi:hypothetical protein
VIQRTRFESGRSARLWVVAGAAIGVGIAFALSSGVAAAEPALRGPVPLDNPIQQGTLPASAPQAAVDASGVAFFSWLQQDRWGGVSYGVAWETEGPGDASHAPALQNPYPLGDQFGSRICKGSGAVGRAALVQVEAGLHQIYVQNVTTPGPSLGPLIPIGAPTAFVADVALACDEAGDGVLAATLFDQSAWSLLIARETPAGWATTTLAQNWSAFATVGLVAHGTAAPNGTLELGVSIGEPGQHRFARWTCGLAGCLLLYERGARPSDYVIDFLASWPSKETLLIDNTSNGQVYLGWAEQSLPAIQGHTVIISGPGGWVFDAGLARATPAEISVLVLRLVNASASVVEVVSANNTNASIQTTSVLERLSTASAASGSLAVGATTDLVAFAWGVEGAIGFGWANASGNWSLLAAVGNPLGPGSTAKSDFKIVEVDGFGFVAAWVDQQNGSVVVAHGDLSGPMDVTASLSTCGAPIVCSGLRMVEGGAQVAIAWDEYNASGPPGNHSLFAWVVNPRTGVAAPPFLIATGLSSTSERPALAVGPAGELFVAWIPTNTTATGLRIFKGGLSTPGTWASSGFQETTYKAESPDAAYWPALDSYLVAWGESNSSAPVSPFELRWILWPRNASGLRPGPGALLGAYERAVGGRFAIAENATAPRLAFVQPLGNTNAPADLVALVSWDAAGTTATLSPVACPSVDPSLPRTQRSRGVSIGSSSGRLVVAWLEGPPESAGDESIVIGVAPDPGSTWECARRTLRLSGSDHAAALDIVDGLRTAVGLLVSNRSTGWTFNAIAYVLNAPPPAPTDLVPSGGALLETRVVLLSWSAEPDLDGDALSFVVQLSACNASGPGIEFSTSQTFLDVGSYLGDGPVCWRVGASDGFEMTWSIDANFTITRAGPVAYLDLPQGSVEGDLILLSGGRSTGAAQPLRYSFDIDSDGAFEFDGFAPEVKHAYPNEGLFTVTLRVTDSVGRTATATAVLVVVNGPPSIDVGLNRSVAEGSTETWSAVVSDPGPNDQVAVVWIIGDYAVLEGSSVEFTATRKGTFKVRAIATDDAGTSHEASFWVTVYNVPPTVSLSGPYRLEEGEIGEWTALVADPTDGPAVMVTWTIDGNAVGSGRRLLWRATVVGNHTIVAAADDGNGGTAEASIALEVADRSVVVQLRLVDRGADSVTLEFSVEGALTPPTEWLIEGADRFNVTYRMVLPGNMTGRTTVSLRADSSPAIFVATARWSSPDREAQSNQVVASSTGFPAAINSTDLGFLLWILPIAVAAAIVVLWRMRRGRWEAEKEDQ